MKIKIHLLRAALLLSAFCFPLSAFSQGSLTPPGAPAPTMKTLDQLDAKLEKRTPISSLPFFITNGGSYYFTANLVGIGAIYMDADNVTVDLNGFTLGGGPCSATGFFVGAVRTNLCIRNGVIADRGGFGIGASGAVNCQLIDLRVSGNGSGGVQIGPGSLVLNCVVRANNGIGINTGDNCVIRGCVSTANAGKGLNAGINSLVDECSVSANGDYGIVVGDGSSIHKSNSQGNVGGISAGPNCLVQQCKSVGNTGSGIFTDHTVQVLNCVVTDNSSYGIHVAQGCRVSGCLVAHSGWSGIYVYFPGCELTGNTCLGNNISAAVSDAGIFIDDSDNRVEGNHVTGSSHAGIQVANGYFGNIVVRNTVAGNGASNYIDPGGNDFGPIGTAATATSPWANISH